MNIRPIIRALLEEIEASSSRELERRFEELKQQLKTEVPGLEDALRDILQQLVVALAAKLRDLQLPDPSTD
jgi:F0F1-type ATP synthase membrane subunit b/b'